MDYTKDTSNFSAETGQKAGHSYDLGLRRHMLSVYQQMFLALVITMVVAGLVAYSPALQAVVYGPAGIVVMLATIAIPFYFVAKLKSISLSNARALLLTYAALMGATLSYTLVVFGPLVTIKALLCTTLMFGSMCIYGYTTQADLSKYRNVAFMAVMGLLIAGLVNLFMKSNALEMLLSFVGVIVFAAITAYDTQMAKDSYYQTSNNEVRAKAAIMCALTLYMDFINIFIYMLRLFASARGRD